MPRSGQISIGNQATRAAIESALAMSDETAISELERWRWWPFGAPECPRCSAAGPYTIAVDKRTGRLYRCRVCRRDYTTLSGTVFGAPKMAPQKYVAALRAFSDPKLSARQFAVQAQINERTAYVLLMKLRLSQSAAAGGAHE